MREPCIPAFAGMTRRRPSERHGNDEREHRGALSLPAQGTLTVIPAKAGIQCSPAFDRGPHPRINTFMTFCRRRAASGVCAVRSTFATSWPQVWAGAGSLRRVSS